MPQMAPVWWLSLMLFFISTFFLSISFVYFLVNYKLNLITSSSMKNLNWSW